MIKMPKYNDTNTIKKAEKIITAKDWKKITKRFPGNQSLWLGIKHSLLFCS